ncbi:MAG TPA: transposase family protein [bacterium]|nr:transposase family protein [bacterium]
MTDGARREYAAALRERYQAADKRGRGQILDEYCRTTGCHRKAASRRLARPARATGRRSGRPRQYGAELLPILDRVWQASDHLCGKLLAPMIAPLLRALEQHHGVRIDAAVRDRLLAASPATLDRLLRPLRRRRARQPRRASPALHTLRAQVPLRTWSQWTGVTPGAVQGDLVLHCGESTAGFYLTTLVAVDVATSWTELQALWGMHYHRVAEGMRYLGARFPFPLREWHSDNGSEFLNEALLAWCRRRRIRVSRGRPYRKNDQAWVEQRNGLAVRRLVGYDRYSSRAAFTVLQQLYARLRLQLNFFRPVRKLLSKQRVGSKVVKRYDPPQTPYQRLLAAGVLTPAQQRALAQQVQALDPVALAHDIERGLDMLWKLADTRRTTAEVAHE